MPNSCGLGGIAPALDIRNHVMLVLLLNQGQGLLHNHPDGFPPKIRIQLTTINGVLARSGKKADTGDCRLALSRSPNTQSFAQPFFRLSSNGQQYRLLGGVGMLRARINLQFCGQRSAVRIFGQHPNNRLFDNIFGMFCQHLLGSGLTDSARILGMVVIHFLLPLIPGKANPTSIDDNDKVAVINMGSKCGIVFAAQNLGHSTSQTADRLALGINKMPATGAQRGFS